MAEEIEVNFRNDESLRFTVAVSSRDPNTRSQALDGITRSFDAWLDGYGSPKDKETLGGNNHVNGLELSSFRPRIEEQLPELLKLSIRCPFEDVRERCKNILADLKDRDPTLHIPRCLVTGPSQFIPLREVIPVDTDDRTLGASDQQIQMIFVDAFLQNNQLEHTTQVMGYHPQYLESFMRTQHHLLHGDGPLPFDYRHYIAMMAAGRHQCEYLVEQHSTEFVLAGGDERWLKGLNHIPQKLRDLYEINKILAHRPWLINKTHIEKLTRGNDNWSLSEVMHALILLAHFHSLASFVYGCGINAEIDHDSGHSSSPPPFVIDSSCNANDTNCSSSNNNSPDSNHSSDVEVGIEALMERMKKLTEEVKETPTQEEMLKRFEKVESQSVELTAAVVAHPSPPAGLLRYVEDPDFVYQDFAKRGCVSEIPTFRAQDYSWEDHGYSLANRLYSGIGNLLEDKFRVAYNLTYYTMGDNTDVDTTSFRRAIWNYIHCMYGIRHDDYNYGEVNHLLERNLKAFIKTVTCFPERTTKKDYDTVMREFKHSEKVHVNLMLLEARLQGELLYSLRAVMNYMT